ncbi:Na+/H+ antiporter NhaC family protein [Aquilutibacter rugosus]|uniref:Na+/H+ antiporter NhaC family protein n=1 Tax=Aquilutibacter rugosus TaxID=3115820 RepID=UPI002F3FC04C
MTDSPRPSALALLPLLLFLALFFGAGLYFTAAGTEMGFYQLRAPVAILPALALGAYLAWRRGVKPTETLLEGMGHSNVMLMCLVFLLAGAFATVSKAIGAVDTVVALGLGNLPPVLILPGMFLVSALVALAIGTSMGTIAAVAPIALGVATQGGFDLPLMIGAVIGGAMFGDNLSMISDTTIAATRSQGVRMKDKFRENLKIALPAALITAGLLFALGDSGQTVAPSHNGWWLALPYLLVLVLALIGMDVLLVLAIGIAVAGAFGFIAGDYSVVRFGTDIYAGFESMIEIMLLSMLIGGLAELMRAAGGLAWLSDRIRRFAGAHSSRRAGEFSIASLSLATDVLTANNTVAILVSGPLAKDIADHHGVARTRSASLLDIFSCVAQGVIPYGAQILLAASLAKVSPLTLAANVHYCWILAAVTIGFMLFRPSNSVS